MNKGEAIKKGVGKEGLQREGIDGMGTARGA